MGKIKKKFKMKKKVILIPIICVVALLLIGGIGYFIYNQQEINKIKSYYHEQSITVRNTHFWNKNKEIVADVNKGIPLTLEKTKIKSKKDQYFKIKGTDFYIYYKDIKENKIQEETTANEHEIPFNKNVTSKKVVSLMKESKKVITLKKECNLPLLYETEKSYFINFQNQIYEIEKQEDIALKDVENTKEKEADHISVIYYEEISDNCTHDYCTDTNHFKEEMNALKENGYYTITKEDYEKVVNHYIRLKDKPILITTSLSTEQVKPLSDELSIIINSIGDREPVKYYSTNKTTNKDTTKDYVNRYQIRRDTSTENFIRMANGEEVKEANNPNQKIAVLNYHFFYGDGEGCNESICLYTGKFREELDYLKENHYKTLTMDEFKRWMYGEIELPTRSVLLTVDDGALGTGTHNGNKLIPTLEEYKMNATLFLIAGWWGIENYQSPNLDVQSHTYDMHLYGSCGRGQINCATYEEALNDLKKSLEIIKNDDSFCFPFYMYSDTSIQAVKDAGFKLAFVGGMKKASRNDNKYLIPRYPIHSSITLNDFIEYVS